MTETEAKRILEALLLVSDKPLLMEQARDCVGTDFDAAGIRRLLMELSEEYVQANRGIRILEVAEGFQLITDPGLAPYVMRLTRRVRSVRLSRPSLETLAIIAYRQPMTRIEIEQVRGVDASGVLDTLLKLSLVRVTGRKETVGRPILYGTTREFLDHFGLKGLSELPTLEELKGLASTPTLAAEESEQPVVAEPNTEQSSSP